MPLIWLFSFHQFRQFDQFLLILIQSLISLIAIILIVADSPNKASQKNQEKFIQLANIFHNWWSWQLQQFSHAIPPICFFSILLHCVPLVQTAPLNLSVIPFLSLDLSIWLIPFPIISNPLFHDFHQFHQFHSFNLINCICF